MYFLLAYELPGTNVVIGDSVVVRESDLGCQFFLTATDVGQNVSFAKK
jgi:hypothetical protein